MTRSNSRFGQIRKNGNKFYPRYMYKGVYYKPGRGFPNKSLARQWLTTEEDYLSKCEAFGNPWKSPEQRQAEKQRQQQRSSFTVADLVMEWMQAKFNSGDWKGSTYDTNESALESRVLKISGVAAELRDMPVAEVTKADARRWWDAVQSQQPTEVRRNNHGRTLLQQVFRYAEQCEYITRSPAVDLTKQKPPRGPVVETPMPGFDELNTVCNAVGENWRLPAVLCLFHGLRGEETLGLQRKHLIYDKQADQWIIQVRQTRVKERNRDSDNPARRYSMVVGPPKTEHSRRDVPLAPRYNELMRNHLDKWVGDSPDDFVTVTSDKTPSWDSGFRDAVARQRDAAGFDWGRNSLHAGRGYVYTLLRNEGLTDKQAGKFIGDTDTEVLRKHYERLQPQRMDDAIARMFAKDDERARRASGENVINLDDRKQA